MHPVWVAQCGFMRAVAEGQHSGRTGAEEIGFVTIPTSEGRNTFRVAVGITFSLPLALARPVREIISFDARVGRLHRR